MSVSGRSSLTSRCIYGESLNGTDISHHSLLDVIDCAVNAGHRNDRSSIRFTVAIATFRPSDQATSHRLASPPERTLFSRRRTRIAKTSYADGTTSVHTLAKAIRHSCYLRAKITEPLFSVKILAELSTTNISISLENYQSSRGRSTRLLGFCSQTF